MGLLFGGGGGGESEGRGGGLHYFYYFHSSLVCHKVRSIFEGKKVTCTVHNVLATCLLISNFRCCVYRHQFKK